MKKNLKISKKTYETIFSFKIEGTMGDPIIPTPPPPQPHPPPFPPLNPFPSGPGYPGYPGYPGSPFGPLPVVEDYPGLRPWKEIKYRYTREYWVHPPGSQYDWIPGQAGIDFFEQWNQDQNKQISGYFERDPETLETKVCEYSFTIPTDNIEEETSLGMYPTDEEVPFPLFESSFVTIATFGYFDPGGGVQRFCSQAINLGELGVQPGDFTAGGIYGQITIARKESFSLVFSGETVLA